MPRLHGVRERRHQPFWDSLIRTTGAPATAVTATSKLFGNANVGQLSLTNLQVAGQLASDQTYVVLALRCYLYFDGTNRRDLIQQTSSQLFFTFNLGDKPHPAGGGVWGQAGDGSSIFNNGLPSQESILRLARPIVIPVRQNISVDAQFFAVGTTNVLDLINGAAGDDQQVIQYLIDGLQTRDVQ